MTNLFENASITPGLNFLFTFPISPMMSSWPDKVREQRAQELGLPSKSSWYKVHRLEKLQRREENKKKNGLSKAKDPRVLARKVLRKERKKQLAFMCGKNSGTKWKDVRDLEREMFKKELVALAESLGLPKEATEREVDRKLRLDGSILTAKDIICRRRGPNG